MSRQMMLATYRMEKQFALLLAGIMGVVAVWPLFGGGAVAWTWLLLALLPLLFRLLGRDALRLKQMKASSYWLEQDKQWSPESFKDQF